MRPVCTTQYKESYTLPWNFHFFPGKRMMKTVRFNISFEIYIRATARRLHSTDDSMAIEALVEHIPSVFFEGALCLSKNIDSMHNIVLL